MEPTWSVETAARYGERLLIGARVRLRGLRDDDLPHLVRWQQDPAIAVLQSNYVVPPSEAAAREVFARWSANQAADVGFCIETLSADDRPAELVGHLGLFGVHAKNRSATFGIGLGPEHLGRGYGSDATALALRYAFQEMNLHRVELAVFAFNERAIRAYERAGFVVEGRRRDVVFHDGGWHDEMVMAALSTDAPVRSE